MKAQRTQLLLAGRWTDAAGEAFVHVNPATGADAWRGRAADAAQVDAAVAAARAALPAWSSLPLEDRADCLRRFAEIAAARRAEFVEAISTEVGKPRWESATEAASVVAKIEHTLDAHAERRSEKAGDAGAGAAAAVRFKPMGVMAVLGPFNLPAHLPNGHVAPALLAGNTVVFKPSETAPGVGALLAECWHDAGLPPCAINLVQGGRSVGGQLVNHAQVDGVLFTGGFAAGRAIARATADEPGKILALEMGGNNPLVVWDAGDLRAAAYTVVQSAFITAGQRCSCARRLIVQSGDAGERLIERLVTLMRRTRVGAPDAQPEPFMGPVISAAAAERLLDAQRDLRALGGAGIVEMARIGDSPAMLSPGLIDVTAVPDLPDEEHFGPLLQVIRVDGFDEALRIANDTRYGLCATLLSDRRDLYERFRGGSRAGVINWNRQSTGASSKLPFGGVGRSGNFRPSGYWAVDYCSYPVASLESATLALPAQTTPGIDP